MIICMVSTNEWCCMCDVICRVHINECTLCVPLYVHTEASEEHWHIPLLLSLLNVLRWEALKSHLHPSMLGLQAHLSMPRFSSVSWGQKLRLQSLHRKCSYPLCHLLNPQDHFYRIHCYIAFLMILQGQSDILPC